MLNDSERLVKRLRTRRAPVSVFGEESPATPPVGPVVDPETLDDGDFYQQLLHELLQSQLSTDEFAEPGQLAKHWAALREYKQRSKPKVDTRASKGRKIRYDVHPKLVSFVVPTPRKGVWHESREEELFANLLGRSKKSDGERSGAAKQVDLAKSQITIFG